MKTKNVMVEIFWRLLLVLFLYTALDKLLNFSDFIVKMNAQPFDDRYTPVLVYAVPGSELLACLLLIMERTRYFGFVLSAVLMTAFTTYVALVTFHYYDSVPCSCSAIHEKLTWGQHFIVNSVFLAMSASGALFLRNTSSHADDHADQFKTSTA